MIIEQDNHIDLKQFWYTKKELREHKENPSSPK